MRLLCAHHSQEEHWEFLIIDAFNTFNEDNQTEMLWSIQNDWPSGVQFTFNCYCHWSSLVVHITEDESGHFLHSKEGVTQGDPLDMIT